jgi:hypothetical protein
VIIESNGQEFCGYPAGDCVCAEKLKEVEQELKALREVADVAKVLLENHEEATGSCAVCLSDGRGTHAEQLETALQKLEKARRG